jgi:predicted GNAT family acetyltransferase
MVGNTEVEEFKDVAEFLLQCETFMLERETENNLILGLADAMKKKSRSVSAPVFFGVYEHGSVVGAGIRTDEGRPFSVTRMKAHHIDALCSKIKASGINLAGVVGEEKTSEHFAKAYSAIYKVASRLVMHQGVYELHKLIEHPPSGLELVLASENETKVCQAFLEGFIKDCFPNDKNFKEVAFNLAKRHINNKALYLLSDMNGQYVSMAANNRSTKNSACVSLVYTPKRFRGRGYGSLVTALVSQKMLESGKVFCNLFTDLANPTSNSIYKKIGYLMVGKSKHFEFKN